MRRLLDRALFAAAWLAFAVLLLAIIWVAGRATPLAQILGALSIATLFAHAVMALGWREAGAFAAICLTVTFTLENIGVATGFPFGHYAFRVGARLPHVGAILIIVGPLYFGMGYAAWVIACLLTGSAVSRPDGTRALFTTPIAAAFVMTQWDVVMDPPGATLAKAWAWYDSGGYFGVPLSNFLGWFLVTWMYFQAFAAFAYWRRLRAAYRVRPAWFWAVPILLYLAAGLCHLPPLLDADFRAADACGRVWFAADIRETAAIVALFTMLPTSLLALLRLSAPSGVPWSSSTRQGRWSVDSAANGHSVSAATHAGLISRPVGSVSKTDSTRPEIGAIGQSFSLT